MTGERFARISERAIRCRDLSAVDWRVLACIALHADVAGRAYPGMTTIAEMTGVRRQDVPRTIRRLEQFRILRCDPGAAPNGANAYTLIFDDDELSAGLRTVRNGADPQQRGQGVRHHPCGSGPRADNNRFFQAKRSLMTAVLCSVGAYSPLKVDRRGGIRS